MARMVDRQNSKPNPAKKSQPGGGVRMTDRSYKSVGPRPNANQPLRGITVAQPKAKSNSRSTGLQAPQIGRAARNAPKARKALGKVVPGLRRK